MNKLIKKTFLYNFLTFSIIGFITNSFWRFMNLNEIGINKNEITNLLNTLFLIATPIFILVLIYDIIRQYLNKNKDIKNLNSFKKFINFNHSIILASKFFIICISWTFFYELFKNNFNGILLNIISSLFCALPLVIYNLFLIKQKYIICSIDILVKNFSEAFIWGIISSFNIYLITNKFIDSIFVGVLATTGFTLTSLIVPYYSNTFIKDI